MTILEIKNDLMKLWTEETAYQSYAAWFEALKPRLHHFFGIEQSDFLIYDEDGFVPLEGHRSISKRNNAIPIKLIENGKFKGDSSYIHLFRDKGYEYADELMIFWKNDQEPLGLLLINSTDKWDSFAKSPYFTELENSVSHLIQTVRKMSNLVTREKNYRQLFSVTEVFNSTMDSQVILDSVLHAIADSFPTFTSELLLSQDQKELTHTYKMFDYLNERPSAIDAFVSGKMTIENATDLSKKLINAPIKGRQGIYGVLQIKVPLDYIFSGTQRKFVRLLVNTAGNALENASLYDQSHRLNEDLQLVNETSRKLNSNMCFDEMIAFLKQQLNKAFKPQQIAFVFYTEEQDYEISQMSTDYFRTTYGESCIHFVSNYLLTGKDSLFDASFSSTNNVGTHFESVIAIPITNQQKTIGFVVCMHEEKYYFSFDSFKLMQSLIGHSSLALANSMLRDQLQELVDKDHLTKLYARRYLDKAIEKSFEKGEGGVLILLDIDDFKLVNDRYGHEVGDQVLKQISSYILAEIEGKGIAARWGGEELALYLPSTNGYDGSNFANQLVREIPLVTNPSVTMSSGINSWSPSESTTFKDLFNYTDKALYIAKETGKNQVIINET